MKVDESPFPHQPAGTARHSWEEGGGGAHWSQSGGRPRWGDNNPVTPDIPALSITSHTVAADLWPREKWLLIGYPPVADNTEKAAGGIQCNSAGHVIR